MRFYLLFILFSIISCSPSTELEVETSSINMIDSNGVNENPNIQTISNEEPAQLTMDDIATEGYDSDEYEEIDWDDYMSEMTQDFSFVIIISTTRYDEALDRAIDASEKLGYPLQLRGLHPNEETGLSLPKDVCEGICGGGMVEYPQYLPRNDWGDSKYVSIEYSNGFDGFNPGYFIVIIASGEKGDPIIQEALEESRQYYEDAYAKTCSIWVGCSC